MVRASSGAGVEVVLPGPSGASIAVRTIGGAVTPRGTDSSLALFVALGVGTGLATWFAGSEESAWVFAAHAVAGTALAPILVWKLRRVWRRVAAPRRWDGRTAPGLGALTLVALALGTGFAWSTGLDVALAGMALLGWHVLLGALLGVVVLAHARVRARRPRAVDLRSRRQLLIGAAVAAGALAAWAVQRPAQRTLGLPGARRRFTGSYDAGSFTGNDYPVTSWVADDPRALDPAAYRLAIGGRVDRPTALTVSDLDRGDDLTATLDCTGGFHSTQRWRGVRLGRLLDEAGVRDPGDHVRVISHTGYRWGFALADARDLLLATRVGDEPLSHGHGAPCRLVVPGHRGFQWVKWVTRIEVHDGPDPGAAASTVWSSLTAEGRGR
jgi:DMSO/TMAO reductase YedYZ molybdopterin-dependent catalytic subunit